MCIHNVLGAIKCGWIASPSVLYGQRWHLNQLFSNQWDIITHKHITTKVQVKGTWIMKVFYNTKIDVLLHRFCMAFGESKDILMTDRKGVISKGTSWWRGKRRGYCVLRTSADLGEIIFLKCLYCNMHGLSYKPTLHLSVKILDKFSFCPGKLTTARLKSSLRSIMYFGKIRIEEKKSIS